MNSSGSFLILHCSCKSCVNSVSNTRAEFGQPLTQAQHRVHFVGSVTMFPSSPKDIAWVGHKSIHIPSATHQSIQTGAIGGSASGIRYGRLPLIDSFVGISTLYSFSRLSAPNFLAQRISLVSGRPSPIGIPSLLKLCSPMKAPAESGVKPSFTTSSYSSTSASS